MTEQQGGTRRIRAGDADRERVVDALREHHGAGRLDADEFTERMEAAMAARYLDELPPLLADLPEPSAEQPTRERPEHERPPWPPWAGGPQWTGVPPWTGGPPPWVRRRRLPLPLLLVGGVLVLLALGALFSGHFPWPLLWIGLVVWCVGPWKHRRHHAHHQHATPYRD